jgi:competence protein ComEC
MLPYWKESPFVRILLPFLAGILLYLLLPSSSVAAPALTIGAVSMLLILYNFSSDFFKLKFAFVYGIAIQMLLLTVAYLICILHHPASSQYWYKHHEAKYTHALIQVVAPPEQKAKTLKVEAAIVQLFDSATSISTCGKALLYFQNSDNTQQIKQGDYILVKNNLKDITKSGNPGSFDYAQYCASKSIFQSAYLKDNEWQKTTRHTEDSKSYFAHINEYTRCILKKYIPDSNAHGVAEALLLGYRTDIDDKIWQAYTDTGIVHIIAISGMHMAMVYGSSRWLLLLLPFFNKRKAMAVLISILFMWSFACITGLPASVTRAAIMFTFIGMGEMLDQKSNSINTLAASAFCMLCYNPMMIYDVGFQLSYMAVLSLIIFYSPVYNLLYVSNKIADAVWKLMAMTLAAQILTLPICIYYFHQFPLLFLFTNLFAVPLTTVILYVEIILVLLHLITPVATILGSVISVLVNFVNTTVLTLSQYSFAVWSAINITVLQMLLLFLFIIYCSLWLYSKRSKHFLISSATLLVFSFTLLHQQYNIMQQHKVIVYNISGQKSIEFISQNQYYNPDEDSILRKTKNDVYTLKPAHTFFSVKRCTDSLTAFEKDPGIEYFSFKRKKIMRISHTNFNCEKPLNIDVLIVSDKCEIAAAWLMQNLVPACIVLDSSVPFWKIETLQSALKNLKIPVHTVSQQGAFVLDVS